MLKYILNKNHSKGFDENKNLDFFRQKYKYQIYRNTKYRNYEIQITGTQKYK